MKYSSILLLTLLFCENLHSQDCIKIGSSKDHVKKIQGAPPIINTMLDLEIWEYSGGSITFKNGSVISFRSLNSNNALLICGSAAVEKRNSESAKSSASKEQTEEWILSKLNNYVEDYSIGDAFSGLGKTKYQTFEFTFEGEALKITYTTETSRHRVSDNTFENYSKSCYAVIPIADFTDFYKLTFSPYSRNSPSSNCSIRTKFSSIYISEYEGKSDNFSLFIDFSQEDNLDKRLNSAFKHLATFYKKKTTTEVF